MVSCPTAFELRLAGLTYRQIAERLGCSVHEAYRQVRRVIVQLMPGG